MDEEMEYAEMLEIPVSTVNVTKKQTKKSKKTQDLKEKVITKINDTSLDPIAPNATHTTTQTQEQRSKKAKATQAATTAETNAFPTTPLEATASDIISESSPITIPRKTKKPLFEKVFGKSTNDLESNNESHSTANSDTQTDEYNLPIYNYDLWENSTTDRHQKRERRYSLIVGLEFAACIALCFGIFLTNVFMPNSAINTFFRSLAATPEQTDARTYSDFVLSSILSEEDAELTLSPTGIISFQEAGCVYAAADGTVETITQNNDGTWTIKVAHSTTFSEIISGLSYASCSVGSIVKSNIPIGYSDGNAEVQVSMYESGALLNCFYLTENGNLAWTED